MKERTEGGLRMSEEFISESIKPVAGTFDTRGMISGEPGVPGEFIWREKTFRVKKVLRTWRKTGPCSHGSGEMYTRKHFYEILVESGEQMQLYFDRQPAKGKAGTPRWWLFSLVSPENN